MPLVGDSTELTAGPPSHSTDSEAAQVDVAKARVSPQHQSAASSSAGAVVDTASQHVAQCEHVALPKLAARTVLNPWQIDWATLLKRTYDFDVLKCPCGGRLKAVELVTEAARAKGLLAQFGMSAKPPPIARARSPDWD